MQYGPSIPPRTFLNTSPQFFTKQGFANYLARALQSVGMIPLNALNTYDLADPAKAEYDPGSSANNYFWWDYPTSEVYTIGGIPYRPCLGMAHTIYRAWATSDTTIQGKGFAYYCGQNVLLMPFRRRADRMTRGDLQCFNNMQRGYNNLSGFGNYDNDAPGYFAELGGCGVGWSRWKLWSSWADANMQQLLFVNRVFVHLSPAGLVIQVGTHPTRRDETCNIINCMAAFHGGRIPNRALAPANDVLRDTVDPVAWLDLGGYANGYYTNSSRDEMITISLGAGRTVNDVLEPFNAALFGYIRSIDYFDDAPVNNAPATNYPRPSPTVRGGAGVHLLHRACFFTYANIGTTVYVGRVDTRKQINGIPLTAWQDAFYFPNLALCDRVVPPGPRVDPVTGKNWYTLWATPRQQALAIDYDGVTTVSSPTAGAETFTLEETIPIDVTALPESTPSTYTTSNRSTPNSAFVGHARDLLGVFGGITIYAAQYDVAGTPSNSAYLWKKPAGVNGFSIATMGRLAEANLQNHLWLELSGLSTDPRDYYWLEYDYRGRVNNAYSGDPAGNDYIYFRAYYGGGDAFTGDSALDWFNFMRVGATVSYQNFYYNFVSPNVYGAKGLRYPAGAPITSYSVDRFQANAAGRAMFSFMGLKDYGTNDANYCPSFDIRNLILKRYRRT